MISMIPVLYSMLMSQNLKCTLVGTFGGTLTNGEEHRACAFTAAWSCSAVAQDSPLLGHQVVLERLDQQVLAL